MPLFEIEAASELASARVAGFTALLAFFGGLGYCVCPLLLCFLRVAVKQCKERVGADEQRPAVVQVAMPAQATVVSSTVVPPSSSPEEVQVAVIGERP